MPFLLFFVNSGFAFAGSAEQRAPHIPQAARPAEIGSHAHPFREDDIKRILQSERLGQAVSQRLAFRRSGKDAEDPIKDDQDAAEILVEPRWLRAVSSRIDGI